MENRGTEGITLISQFLLITQIIMFIHEAFTYHFKTKDSIRADCLDIMLAYQDVDAAVSPTP